MIMATFLATLMPMLTLFLCIAAGFAAFKGKLLPDSAGKTLAMLETWIFCPALSFMTMVRYCTVDLLKIHAANFGLAVVAVAISVGIAAALAPLFVKEKGMEQGVFAYALAFANSGYMGDPIVLGLFGEEALAYYKVFCLPLNLVIFTWGISRMIPADTAAGGRFASLKRILNPPTVAMLAGVACGLTGVGKYLPVVLTDALDTLKVCMGPAAMLLAGITIARYDFVGMLKKKKVYVASLLRLTLLPAILIGVLCGIRVLAERFFHIAIPVDVLFLCFFATATPFGLNTIIFPEAYNGNPETGASMTMISHTMCILTIPILYTLMLTLFGTPFVG